MMLAKTSLRKNLLIIQTLARLKSTNLLSLNILMIMIIFNSEKLADEFLLNVKNRVERSNSDFSIKCGFPLENIQPSPIENEQPIRNSRYWSTEVHQIRLFNGSIYFNLKESVLKRLIKFSLYQRENSYYFSKMTDFLDFEAFEDSNVNEIVNAAANLVDDVTDDDLLIMKMNLMKVLLTIMLLQM